MTNPCACIFVDILQTVKDIVLTSQYRVLSAYNTQRQYIIQTCSLGIVKELVSELNLHCTHNLSIRNGQCIAQQLIIILGQSLDR